MVWKKMEWVHTPTGSLMGVHNFGSDGSEKDGVGSHAYRFTDGHTYGNIWGGSAITPGSQTEMSSL